MILLHLSMSDLLRIQRTNKQIQATIAGSTLIQRKLFRLDRPASSTSSGTPEHQHGNGHVNQLLLSSPIGVPDGFGVPAMASYAIFQTSNHSRKQDYRIWDLKALRWWHGTETTLPSVQVHLVAYPLRRSWWWMTSLPPKLEPQGSHRDMLLFDTPAKISVVVHVWNCHQPSCQMENEWHSEQITFGELLDVAQDLERREMESRETLRFPGKSRFEST